MSQKTCPSCNAPNDVNAAFCGSCGAPLSSGQAAAPPAPPSPPTYQPPTPPVYQAPTQNSYQPPTFQQPTQTGYPTAPQATNYQVAAQQQGYQQPGYAPGIDPNAARAIQAAQAAGLVVPAGYAPAGFGVRFVAVLIDGVIMWVVNMLFLLLGPLALLSFFVGIAYYIYFWGAKGQTPGKMAMGLYVVSSDGQPMSYGKAAIRYIGYMVSGLTLGIGFLMVAFDDAKRGLHDRIGSTLVVKRIG